MTPDWLEDTAAARRTLADDPHATPAELRLALRGAAVDLTEAAALLDDQRPLPAPPRADVVEAAQVLAVLVLGLLAAWSVVAGLVAITSWTVRVAW